MFRSVRGRLTMWYAGVLAVVLIFFAALLYFLIERRIYAELDEDLGSVLQVVAASLDHEIEEHAGEAAGEESFRVVLRTMHESTFPQYGIVVYRDGLRVALKPAYDGLVPPPAMDAHATPLFFTRGSDRVGTVTTRISYTGVRYRLAATEHMAGHLADLEWLRRTLSLAVPGAVLLAALVGYLLARTSLAPVVAMSANVDRISSSNLAYRLAVTNPDDELGRLAGTFNRLLGRLESAFEQQRQFMADASHELRTPVSVARTAAQVTMESADRSREEYREALGIIDQQMTRLSRVVNDVFLLARADAGAAALHRRRFYLDETLRDSIKAARVLAVNKGLTLQCGGIVEAPFEGDEDLIRQLTLLLLDNAVKYTPDGGSVRVDLSADADAYRIAIADTGPGIPPEAQVKIFERFYRVDKARSRALSGISGGAGLGLSIARFIAEAHGGSVTLERSGADGSVFVVSLPKDGALAR